MIQATEITDVSQAFLQKSRSLLVLDYLPKIERCLAHLSEEDVWARPSEVSNSIGNLLLHLCGNVTQWILGGVGGREYVRHRQQEFDVALKTLPNAFTSDPDPLARLTHER
jgi:hypothetical protein